MSDIKEKIKRRSSFLWALPMLFLAYCQFIHNDKGRQFISDVEPIQVACQKASSCPTVLKGWKENECRIQYELQVEVFGGSKVYCAARKGSPNTYYAYTTDTNKFFMTWRYLGGAELHATGGVNQPLVVNKYSEGEKFTLYGKDDS